MRSIDTLRPIAAALLAGALAAASAVGAGAAHRPSALKAPNVLVSVLRAHTVRLLLEAGLGTANNGLNFDGYANGRMTIVIPKGWHVDVTFENLASDIGHSAVVASWTQPLSASAPRPALPGATTPDATLGTPKGEVVHFRFVAGRAGRYRLECAVPGHASLGMWDVVQVEAHIAAPRLIVR